MYHTIVHFRKCIIENDAIKWSIALQDCLCVCLTFQSLLKNQAKQKHSAGDRESGMTLWGNGPAMLCIVITACPRNWVTHSPSQTAQKDVSKN